MDQSRKVDKPARGQLNREMKCPCRCIRSKYICTAPYIAYIYFYLGTCIFVHGSLIYYTWYAYMFDVVPVHIVYYKMQQYIYVHTTYVP